MQRDGLCLRASHCHAEHWAELFTERHRQLRLTANRRASLGLRALCEEQADRGRVGTPATETSIFPVTSVGLQSILVTTERDALALSGHFSFPPTFSPWQPPICLLSSCIYLLWAFHINGLR